MHLLARPGAKGVVRPRYAHNMPPAALEAWGGAARTAAHNRRKSTCDSFVAQVAHGLAVTKVSLPHRRGAALGLVTRDLVAREGDDRGVKREGGKRGGIREGGHDRQPSTGHAMPWKGAEDGRSGEIAHLVAEEITHRQD